RPGWLMERQALAGADAAMAVDHLPPPVADLARETRALRLAIEAADPADATIDGWVWGWIRSVRELGPAEQEVLERLGLSTGPVERILLGEALDAESSDMSKRTAVGQAEDAELVRRALA